MEAQRRNPLMETYEPKKVETGGHVYPRRDERRTGGDPKRDPRRDRDVD
jgi:hypothetical protein